MDITDGSSVGDYRVRIGSQGGSTGEVTVDGGTWTWENAGLTVGQYGSGTLDIINGGMVSVAGFLCIDEDLDGNSFTNMATGGRLALLGEADDSLGSFLDLIDGTDAIRYWDTDLALWADITTATYGDDYTMDYLTEGDLAGYTMLTVTTPIPEPAGLTLLALAAAILLCRRS